MSQSLERERTQREIVTLLYEKGMIRTFYRDRPEGWTLVSGLYSPLYIQLRPLVSYPIVFEKICRAMATMLQEEAPHITRVIGIAMAGIPVAAGIGLVGGIPAGFTRKLENVKSIESFRQVIASYGEHALVEGELSSGDKIALVDDLVTRFDSKQIALAQVMQEVKRRNLTGVECRTIAVVLDREQGGREAAVREGLELLALIPFRTVGLPLLQDVMDKTEWKIISQYLENPDAFQAEQAREDLRKVALTR